MSRHEKDGTPKAPPWASRPGYRGAFSTNDDVQGIGTSSRGWSFFGAGPGGNESGGGSAGSHRKPGPSDAKPAKRGLFGTVPEPKPLFGGKKGKSGGGGGGARGLSRSELNHPFGGGKSGGGKGGSKGGGSKGKAK